MQPMVMFIILNFLLFYILQTTKKKHHQTTFHFNHTLFNHDGSVFSLKLFSLFFAFPLCY